MKLVSNIYNFSDYRDFLKDRYRQLKDGDPVFSFRHFSKTAGFGSPNYLKLVMDGKRNLSSEAIGKFATGLRLDEHETEFFQYMVEFNQCSDGPKKRVYEAKLMYLRELFKVKHLIPELYDYYHDWYHAAIRETLKNGPAKNDPAAIGQSLVPALTEAQARRSIELLMQLKFVEEGPGGMLVAAQGEQPIEVNNAALAQKIYHEQMAGLAAQSIYTQGPETQDFEAVTISLPPEKVGELKKRLHELALSIGSQHSHNSGDAVYQLNIQLFALTRGTVTGISTSDRASE